MEPQSLPCSAATSSRSRRLKEACSALEPRMAVSQKAPSPSSKSTKLRERAFMDEAMKRKMEEQETGEDNLGTWANYAPT